MAEQIESVRQECNQVNEQAQRLQASRAEDTQKRLEHELSVHEAELRKLQTGSDAQRAEHERCLEELVQAQTQARTQESKIKTLEVSLKDARDDLEESQAQLREASYSLQRSEQATLDRGSELRRQLAEVTASYKAEQGTVSQLRFEIVAKDDAIEKMSQDTDQLVT